MKPHFKDMLWLAEYVRIVDGKNRYCVINLKDSEFILTNATGGRLLSIFQEGKYPAEAINEIKPHSGFDDDIDDFLNTSIERGLLVTQKPKKDFYKDSVSIHRSKISSNAFSLTLELSRKCNQSCIHCYNRSGPNNSNSLKIEEVLKILEDTHRIYSKLLTLVLTGGEPFLYKSIEQVVSQGFKKGFTSIRINTNGSIAPTRSLLHLFKEFSERIEIQITLLGMTPDIHDKSTTCRGSFAKVMKNMQAFTNSGAKVFIAFTKTTYSESQINEAQHFGAKLGIPVIFNDLHPIGRAVDIFKEIVSHSKNQNATFQCERNTYSGETSGLITKDKLEALIDSYPPVMPCGRNTIAISSNGEVLPCMLLQGVVIGNIFKKPLEQIILSDKMKLFWDKISIDNREDCSSCELRYVCGNKCPAVSLNFAGKLGVKSPFCNYP